MSLGATDWSETQIARGLALGDPSAFRALYERTASRALAVALRVLRSRIDAEDVLQDTFQEVWARAREFDPARGSLEAWVVVVCRSRAIDRLRSRGTTQRVEAEASPLAPPDAARVAPTAELAEQREDSARLRVALERLPAEQRNVLELAFFAGLTHREICEQTGDHLGTVKTRLRLGMKKLATALRERDSAA